MLGLNFIVYKDPKELVHIITNPKATIPLCTERMVLGYQAIVLT